MTNDDCSVEVGQCGLKDCCAVKPNILRKQIKKGWHQLTHLDFGDIFVVDSVLGNTRWLSLELSPQTNPIKINQIMVTCALSTKSIFKSLSLEKRQIGKKFAVRRSLADQSGREFSE